MSYQMTHLEVAYRLLDKYKWIKVKPDFLLGAIAPDAVHFYRGDQWLFHESNNSEKIMSLLAESRAYSIVNCVLQKDVETQKKHILSKQYKNKGSYDLSDHRYCTEAVIISFIDECAEELKDILVD